MEFGMVKDPLFLLLCKQCELIQTTGNYYILHLNIIEHHFILFKSMEEPLPGEPNKMIRCKACTSPLGWIHTHTL